MNKNKLNKKDLVIVGLSAVLLILLAVIVVLSKKRDQMIAESLQDNSTISTDDAITSVSVGSMNDLKITEVSADKWIELHNVGSENIDISGLQFEVSGKKEVTVDEGTIVKKDDYYVVELSSNPGKNDKNIITVLDSEGTEVKSFIVPRLSAEKSYGLADEELNIWGYIATSKGKANSSKDVVYLENDGISYSAPGGFYDTSFDLELKCPEGKKIYYTTDGTTPTTDSTLYEETIYITNRSGSQYTYARETLYNRFHPDYMPGTVDSGTFVRAILVDATGKTVGEFSQVYYVGLTKDSDYLNLPVISITTDPFNLIDYENGMLIPGKTREDALIQGLTSEYYSNYYNAWRKPAKIEYFEPSKDKTFEIDSEFYVDTELNVSSRQKGFILDLGDQQNSDYKGSSLIDYISSDGVIRLTSSLNDNTYKIRNLLINNLVSETEMGTAVTKPCVLFIEGEYWGLYVIRQYQDAAYINQKYNLKNEEIVIHSGNDFNTEFMAFHDFVTQNDMADSQNYESAKEMMDIDNFIDYVCLNIFIGNANFYPEKGTSWRTVTENGTGMADGRWRFLSGDLSDTLYMSALQTPTINTYLQPGIQSDLLLQSLLMNEEFCKTFESRMKSMVSQVFDYDKCEEEIDSIVSLMKKPCVAGFRRYFGSVSESSYVSEADRIKEYFQERPENILKLTKQFVDEGGDLERARELTALEEENNPQEADIDENTEENTEEGNTEENTTENTEEEVEAQEDNTNG